MEPFCSVRVLKKLATRHKVAFSEVLECFANRSGPPLKDKREKHMSDPPTLWFIAQTDMGRILKVVYIPKPEGPEVKTAYPANAMERQIYGSLTSVCF